MSTTYIVDTDTGEIVEEVNSYLEAKYRLRAALLADPYLLINYNVAFYDSEDGLQFGPQGDKIQIK